MSIESTYKNILDAPQDTTVLYRKLSLEDLSSIVSLEAAVWPVDLAASQAKIQQRLQWGHIMLGAFKADQLVGIASWRYAHFDPALPMPESFEVFADQPNTPSHNAAYVYNFAISPQLRNTRAGLKLAHELIARGIAILISDQCAYLVGASRCPSYNGSKEPLNRCNRSAVLRAAIDSSDSNDPTLLDKTLPWIQDPVLSFYKHSLDCTFNQILPAFMPVDTASGGYAIGFYKHLNAYEV